jgi:hypothetical protein
MDALEQAHVMTTNDLERLLESYSLNFTLLPLIYEKSIQMNVKKIRRLVIS